MGEAWIIYYTRVMSPQYILVIAVMVVMGWFAFGVIFNLRRGEALIRWMKGGLPRIGEKTTFRWMGTSVNQMIIAQAKKPFRRLETLIVLAPRDVPWLWLAAAFQGRKDTMIFRAQLHSAPLMDCDLADPASWTGRMALREATRRGWESQPYQDLQLMAPGGMLDQASVALGELYSQVGQLAEHCRRISLRRDTPHLELHISFPDHRRQEAASWFEKFRELARSVGE